MKLSEVLLAYVRPFMHCLYFICERKLYARTHVKITRKWESTVDDLRKRSQDNRQAIFDHASIDFVRTRDLFKGIFKKRPHTSPQVTSLKLNSSSEAGM